MFSGLSGRASHIKYVYVTFTLPGTLERGIKNNALVPWTFSDTCLRRPTTCARRPNLLARERFHVVASGPLISSSILSLLPMSGLKTRLAYYVPALVGTTLCTTKLLRRESVK